MTKKWRGMCYRCFSHWFEETKVMTANNFKCLCKIIQNMNLKFLSKMEYFSGIYWCKLFLGVSWFGVIQNRLIQIRKLMIWFSTSCSSNLQLKSKRVTMNFLFRHVWCNFQCSPFRCLWWSISKCIQCDCAREIAFKILKQVSFVKGRLS